MLHASLFLHNMVQPKKISTWSCKSEAGKKLVAGTQNGDVELTSAPKALHTSDPLFLDHKLLTLRVVLTR